MAAAIFIDLDGFTGVNDSVGHGAGDLLLAQAARRLRAVVPPQHTVARWGGDEFAVLMESAASAQEIVDIAERLAGAIAGEPFRVADVDISMTASIGVALQDADPPEHLLRNADVAMSRAKESGGGHVEVFAAHMHAEAVRSLELTRELRRAITRSPGSSISRWLSSPPREWSGWRRWSGGGASRRRSRRLSSSAWPRSPG